jgi:dihydroorotase
MQRLFRGVRFCRSGQTNPDQPTDVIIENGKIKDLGSALQAPGAEVFDFTGLLVLAQTLDLGVVSGEPGLEHREDFAHLDKAASRGGFTAVAPWPDTVPVAHDQTAISFIKARTQSLFTHFLPIGSLSVKAEGKQMSDLRDMHEAGAVAFSDGPTPIASSGLLLQILDYVSAFGGVVMHQPHDETLTHHGQVNEGPVSIELGLPGLPSVAEEIMVERDINLVRYSGAALHLCGISTARSVLLIKQAKAEGLPITASCYVWNAIFDDSAVGNFNVHFKLQPALRSKNDVLAIQNGLADGTLVALQSGHQPWDAEATELEFPYAAFGSSSIETALPLSFDALADTLGAAKLATLWSAGPMSIFKMNTLDPFAIGSPVAWAFMSENEPWTLDKAKMASKSHNSPLHGHTFKHKVKAVVVGDDMRLF